MSNEAPPESDAALKSPHGAAILVGCGAPLLIVLAASAYGVYRLWLYLLSGA